MKNTTRTFGLIAALLALAAPVFGAQIGDDSLTIGKKGSVADKTVKMGAGRVVWNQTAGKMQFSNDSGGSFKNFGSGGGGGSGINLLSDFNFDFEGGTANWTASGGSFTIATTGSNLIFDTKSGVFNASASSQTLSSANIAIPQGFKGGNGSVSCYFKTTATDYKLQAYDGTTVLGETLIPAIPGAPQKVSASFIFPSSGNVRLRVISGSDASDLAVDNCTLGDTQQVQISQANYFGGITVTDGGSCTWSGSGGSLASFSAATTCTYTARGKASAPATQIPAIKFDSMPPGEYYFIARSDFSCAKGSGDTALCRFELYDGATSLGTQDMGFAGLGLTSAQHHMPSVTGHLSLSSSAASKTIEVRAVSVAGSPTYGITTGNSPLNFDVYFFPSQTQQAQTFETVGFKSSVVIGTGSTFAADVASDGAFHTFNEATLATKVFRGSGSAPTTANDAAYKAGSVPAGDYFAYARGSFEAYATGSAGVECSYQLFDGTNSIAVSYLDGVSVGGLTNRSTANFIGGIVSYSAVSSPEIKLQAKELTGSGSRACRLTGVYVEIGLIPLTQNTPAPVLVGGMTHGGAGVKNTVAVDVCGDTACTTACTSDPCAIGANAGEGVSSITRSAAGHYLVNFVAGAFASRPVCTSSNYNATNISGFNTPVTTSQASVIAFNPSTTTLGDDKVGLICIGNK